jgi:hypothetical protein
MELIMALGLLSMLTPLEDRIDRWATSGNAKQILLHPEDYVKINNKKDMIETKYNLPVVCLGGAKGMSDFMNRKESDDEVLTTVAETAKLKSIEEYLEEDDE